MSGLKINIRFFEEKDKVRAQNFVTYAEGCTYDVRSCSPIIDDYRTTDLVCTKPEFRRCAIHATQLPPDSRLK